MLNAIAHGRIGRDVELRFIPSGEAVADIAIACNYGRKDPNSGELPTQWIKATLWGKQAEALAPYLTKGKGVVAVLQDVNIQEFDGKNGKGHSLVGRVVTIDFSVGQPREDQEPERAPARAPAPRQAPTRRPTQHGEAADRIHGKPSTGFDDMDDDIPF
jgi:single-strand DNA-binding protein